MNLACTFALAAVTLFGADKPKNKVKKAKAEKIKIEFRLASTEKTDGTTEAKAPPSNKTVYYGEESFLTNEDIARIDAADFGGQPGLSFRFTKDGADKLEKVSGENIDKQMVLLVDGKVMSVPTFHQKVRGGGFPGSFTKEEAERIAKAFGSKR